VEKKGSHFSFTYTLKTLILKKGQKILKKKNISASEYINYKGMQKKDTETVRHKRLCIIDNGIYVIIDYYMEIDGQPMIAIIQTKESVSSIELPSFI
jgi:hypothetical protein